MEFCKKLQELRKQKGITQEELAKELFVSRTAVSKWESGRGYPNLDSLKDISKFFVVSIDELLSCGEVLAIAEESEKTKTMRFRDLVFGLLDLSVLMLFFLPFFGQTREGIVYEVSLLRLNLISIYIKVFYFVIITAISLFGVLFMVLNKFNGKTWVLIKHATSLILNVVGVLTFIITRQVYVATFLFVFLIIKSLILLKK